MLLYVTADQKLHLRAVGNRVVEAVKRGQSLPLTLTFNDTTLIDDDTEEVDIILKEAKADETSLASCTLTRDEGEDTFSGRLNLATEQITALAENAEVFIEAQWELDGEILLTDDTKVLLQKKVRTGEEGAPDEDQTTQDAIDWLELYYPQTELIRLTAGDANSGKLLVYQGETILGHLTLIEP